MRTSVKVESLPMRLLSNTLIDSAVMSVLEQVGSTLNSMHQEIDKIRKDMTVQVT